jgi:hypothetical protein
MSENIVPVGETPIFEQMVRELAERGKRFEQLLSPKGKMNLDPVKSYGVTAKEFGEGVRRLSEALPKAQDFLIAPSSWITRPVSQIAAQTAPVQGKIDLFLDPETIDPKYRSIGEDTADTLHMKPSTWGSDEE